MKKITFALLGLVLSSSLAWGQAEQKPVKSDPAAEGTSPECDDPSGSCLKNYPGRPAARPSPESVVKTVDKYTGQTSAPKEQGSPQKTESTK